MSPLFLGKPCAGNMRPVMEDVPGSIPVTCRGLSIAYTLSRPPVPGGEAARTNGAMVYESAKSKGDLTGTLWGPLEGPLRGVDAGIERGHCGNVTEVRSALR
ncbi:hypothetical protein GLUCOINTEAF2_0203693 [Komagataeibacter intermedius AF2]|uniref:Uncharacterized protein n=1 Tax=Komagataeibacter intermedius AF2 TaxID=1458464 RepID=A0A0N1FCI9_9PROT|nr:hypothetical protein GLUCOINTEAF2_0203693 [Komagataeibacter intermedius AF2]